MLSRSLHKSLNAVEFVALLTLLRSVAFDRWITVVAALLLLGGVARTRRGSVGGLTLTFATASVFPAMVLLGIAPPWFFLVGLVGALPMALSAGALARKDKQATMLLLALAASVGPAVALAWKEFAWSVFTRFPALMPGIEPNHGLALLGIAGAATAVHLKRKRASASRDGGSHVRVGGPATAGVRVDTGLDASEDEGLEALSSPSGTTAAAQQTGAPTHRARR